MRGLPLNTEGMCRALLTQRWHNPEGYSCGLSALMLSVWALGGTLERHQDVLALLILLGLGKGLTCRKRAAEKCTTTVKNPLQTKPAKRANKFKSGVCCASSPFERTFLPEGPEMGQLASRVDTESVVALSACRVRTQWPPWQLRPPQINE